MNIVEQNTRILLIFSAKLFYKLFLRNLKIKHMGQLWSFSSNIWNYAALDESLGSCDCKLLLRKSDNFVLDARPCSKHLRYSSTKVQIEMEQHYIDQMPQAEK